MVHVCNIRFLRNTNCCSSINNILIVAERDLKAENERRKLRAFQRTKNYWNPSRIRDSITVLSQNPQTYTFFSDNSLKNQISTNLTWNCQKSDVEKIKKQKSIISSLSQFKNYQNRFRNHGENLENVSIPFWKKLPVQIFDFLKKTLKILTKKSLVFAKEHLDRCRKLNRRYLQEFLTDFNNFWFFEKLIFYSFHFCAFQARAATCENLVPEPTNLVFIRGLAQT